MSCRRPDEQTSSLRSGAVVHTHRPSVDGSRSPPSPSPWLERSHAHVSVAVLTVLVGEMVGLAGIVVGREYAGHWAGHKLERTRGVNFCPLKVHKL